MPSRKPRANHLQGQTSPYLLQHLHNPVDWYPWGDAALTRAKTEDKPIFLSIGYAACHWCHVMERESFEDEAVADFLNRHFVSIKVDREERPDIDEIYMNAVQLLTGAGGWPLNMFLTPQLEPFFGGTYFPPDQRYGRPGFLHVLEQLIDAWKQRRPEIAQSAAQLTEQLSRIAAGTPAADGVPVGPAEIQRAAAELAQRFDPPWGGFSPAPKFPPDGALDLLLREHHESGQAVPLQLAQATLQGMARGGMFDHVGGGFARYSVDDQWLVPHFEKMLYNQALLVPVYADAFLVTDQPLYRRVVEQTLDFVRRELTDSGGGCYSSLDADSEGVEGKFYVWTLEQVRELLETDQAELFCHTYGLSEGGNFEGANIPNLLSSSLSEQASQLGIAEAELWNRLEPVLTQLRDAREQRVRPGTDDKILTAWNGLMISAFCRSFQTLGRAEDLHSAQRAADFVIDNLMQDARLQVSYRAGVAQLNGYLDEYAFFGRGLLDLYESCFEPRYLNLAAELTQTMLDRFADPTHGGFFFTSDDHEALLVRNRSLHDGALPSGLGVATELLLRLAIQLDHDGFRDAAQRALVSVAPALQKMPSAFASLLRGAGFHHSGAIEVAIVGAPQHPGTQSLLQQVRQRFLPRLVIAVSAPDNLPRAGLLAGKTAIDANPTAYLCRDYRCEAPTTDPLQLGRQLDDAAS